MNIFPYNFNKAQTAHAKRVLGNLCTSRRFFLDESPNHVSIVDLEVFQPLMSISDLLAEASDMAARVFGTSR